MNVEVVVPATVANLGPGFDCLGMAVDTFKLRLCCRFDAADGVRISVGGAASDGISDYPGENLVSRAMEEAFAAAGARPRGYDLRIDNGIPLAGGLGSSAAAVIGGLLLARAWLECRGRRLDDERLLALAARMEGHADNAAAALCGGVTLAVQRDDGRAFAYRLPLLEYPAVVLAVPARRQATRQARNVLPAQVPHGDAAFNAARSALLVAVLTGGKYELLYEAMVDRLHEPYRRCLYPWLDGLREAAVAAGAYGACLSGAGPAAAALTPADRVSAVASAMQACLADAGLEAEVYRAAVSAGALVRVHPEVTLVQGA